VNQIAAAFEYDALLLVGAASTIAVVMMLAVVIERIGLSLYDTWIDRLNRHYTPLVDRALKGDRRALGALTGSPRRHQLTIARLLLLPLIDDRDPARIAAARDIIRAMSLIPFADRLLSSPWWWRRAIGVRALGLMQETDRTAAIVAALDDANLVVRNTALDALADMQNPAALPAIVVRLNDTSLHRGRRAAALTSFGDRCEEFLLDLASIDAGHRINYAKALSLCGSARSRQVLCAWVRDERVDVRAAALEALGRIGLDPPSAAVAMEALESTEPTVRAEAATALAGWTGAAPNLARHLDDTWRVALHAARSLRAMQREGWAELEARSHHQDLSGALARQMLWEVGTRR
jgi:HEAT repeat protein